MTRGVTPPKGRTTPRRDDRRRAQAAQTARSARWSWLLTGLLTLVVLAALFIVFGGGGGGGGGGVPIGGHGG